jgi:hypothetical protein
MYVYTIYRGPLSVQAQYSRAYPIIISLPFSNQSQIQSHVATDVQSISKSRRRAPSEPQDQALTRITLWQLRYCFCGASSLMRGRVSLLYMLLALASVVFLGSESLGTRDHILLSQISDFPFRRLLRLAGSRWRYRSGIKSNSKLCYDRRSVVQSVLVSSIQLGLTTRFLLLLYSCRFFDVGRSLWRENGFAVYNCCWASPAQSFLSLNPAGLVTIFYSLRFETPPTWRARSPSLYPPGTGWPSYTARH